MGIAAPYRGLSHTSRRFSLDSEEDENSDDISSFNTGVDYFSDHHSLSSEQGFSEPLKYNSLREIGQRDPQAQSDYLKFRPRAFESSYKSPDLDRASPAHQDPLSNRMTYSIKGLRVPDPCPAAIFRPIIRVYPPPLGRPDETGSGLDYMCSSPFIEHIDITTVWKGLLISDAERLLYLDQVFKDSLEDLLADALENAHKEFQQRFASCHEPNFGTLVTPSLNRQLSFNLRHLVLSMNNRLRLCGKLLEKGLWRGFTMLVPLFLASCDCLVGFEGNGDEDTAVEIFVHNCGPAKCISPPGPVNEAAWIPDILSFNEINQIQREGQELIIIPHYCGNAAFTADVTRTNIQFSIESAETWLVWDENISGFRGTVPLFSELGRIRRPGKVYGSPRDGSYTMINVLRVEIKALLIAGYSSSIRFERSIRARLTFKIVPWFAHDSACAPTDDLVRPFSPHYPDYEPPGPASTSSKPEEELEHENPRSNITEDDLNHCVSSQDSRTSWAEHSLSTTSLQSFKMSQRKRRAASDLKIPFPAKRYRENEDKQSLLGLFNSPNKDLSIANFQKESAEFCSRSATPETGSSHSVSSIDTQIASSDVDKAPEVKHREEDAEGTKPFHANLSALAVRNKSLDSIYAMHVTQEKNDVEASPAEQGILPGRQHTDSRNTSLDRHLINGASRTKRRQKDELCNLQSATRSGTSNGISQNPEAIHASLYSPISGSRQSSSSIEIIVEDPTVDPQFRHEQAVLWNILSTREALSKKKEGTVSEHEVKEMFAAMRLSAAEKKDWEMAKMGYSDVWDDIFNSSGSDNQIDMDGSDADSSCQEKPDHSG